MTVSSIFIDTNILLYAFDPEEPLKHEKARFILEPYLTTNRVPVISTQVLHEFSHQMLRRGYSAAQIEDTAEPFLDWHVIEGTKQLFRNALKVMNRYQLSVWDGLIIAAALEAGVNKILTEDLNSGQSYGGVVADNPFA